MNRNHSVVRVIKYIDGAYCVGSVVSVNKENNKIVWSVLLYLYLVSAPPQQLSGVPRSLHNVGLASDSSQNQRNGNRRVPDQNCMEGEGELPTPCSQFFPRSKEQCEAERYRAAG